MDASQSRFSEVFERECPEFLGAAMSFADGDPAFTDAWVYASFEDNVMASSVAYRVDGEYLSLADAHKRWPDRGGATVVRAVSDGLMSIFFELEPAELPNAMVVHYHAPTEEMHADFSYDRVPLAKDESYSAYATRWSKEFRG